MSLYEQIQALTGCTPREYAVFVELSGTNYLQYYTDNDCTAVMDTARRAEFWAWYRNQFDIIDKRFLGSYKVYADAQGDVSITRWLKNEWYAQHQPQNLQAYPHQFIMQPRKEAVA